MSLALRRGGIVDAALMVGICGSLVVTAASTSPNRLTIQQALREAVVRSPALRARQLAVEQAEGRLVTAQTYAYNPELSIEGARRSNGDSTTDRGITLAQELEVGGQRRWRAALAKADIESARALLLRERRLLEARIRTAFVEALRTREISAIEQANAELAQSIVVIARKRFEAGAVAQMEVNLAEVQFGRAQRELHLARGADVVARTILAEAVGLDPATPPDPEGTLEAPTREPPPLAELLTSAANHREDLWSLRKAADSARANIEIARRGLIPNLNLEGFTRREAGHESIAGGAVGIRIPVFNRSRGILVEARAALRESEANVESIEIQTRREVVTALAHYQAARAAISSLQQQVLGTLEENLRLLQRSFESGKTSWPEVLVFRREFVEIQRDYIETLADAELAAIELDLAAGLPTAVSREDSRP